MKNLIILLLLSITCSIQAQVKIGENTEHIDSSSILELESKDKGLLISRLTTEQVRQIQYPATGLIIYNTDLNLLQVNIGSDSIPQWSNLVVSQGQDNKGALLLPVGTDADRPQSPVEGMLRYNIQNSKFEVYRKGSWVDIL